MKIMYHLEDLDCAHCAARMEQAVSALSGIKSVTVNFLAGLMTVEAENVSSDELMRDIQRVCAEIEPDCHISC